MAEIVIKPSLKAVVLWYVLSTILIIAVVAFLYSRQFQPKELMAMLAVPLLLDVWIVTQHMQLTSRRLVLSGDVLRYEDGIVSKTQRSLLLDKIRDVYVSQTVAQRLVGTGDLSVEALGEAGKMSLPNVDSPRKMADLLLAAISKGRGTKS